MSILYSVADSIEALISSGRTLFLILEGTFALEVLSKELTFTP